MNTKLTPGALLLIGLILLTSGGWIKGALGVALSVGGAVCIVLAITGFIKRISNTPKLEKIAQATAKAMLVSFFAIKEKHKYSVESESDKLKIYTQILSHRPDYNQSVIKETLEAAQSLSKIRDEPKGITLNTLVFVVFIREYTLDTGKTLNESQLKKIQVAIDKEF